MIILSDSRQQKGKHTIKEKWFADNGIELRTTKLYVGDYTLPTDQSICVDTKKDIQELIGDICGKSHERFREELIRAQESNIKLIILTEDDGGYCDRKQTIYNKPVTCIDDLASWRNPRAFIWIKGQQKYPNATKGITLMKCLKTMEKKYNCQFLFVRSKKAGEKIIEILTNNSKGKE